MSIRNIIFDMGQVLIRWKPDLLLSRFDITREDNALLVTEMFQSVEWMQLDHGTISGEEAVARMCSRLPAHLHSCVNAVVNGWWTFALTPVPGMGTLVRELKEKGYGIYLLSNAGVTLREYFPGIPGSEYFDGLLVSAEEKLLKPQHEIYYRLYERFGLDPARCFFIDDSPANIEAALCTGMAGTVFRGDPVRLRRELERADIL